MNYCNGCKYIYTDYNTDGSAKYHCERTVENIALSRVRVFVAGRSKEERAIPCDSCTMYEEKKGRKMKKLSDSLTVSCGTCVYWCESAPDPCKEREGTCRARAPRWVASGLCQDDWAVTRNYDWCGQHPDFVEFMRERYEA